MYMWRQTDNDVRVERKLRSDSEGDRNVEPVAPSGRGSEKVKEMSANLVFADEEGDSRSDIDVVI